MTHFGYIFRQNSYKLPFFSFVPFLPFWCRFRFFWGAGYIFKGCMIVGLGAGFYLECNNNVETIVEIKI